MTKDRNSWSGTGVMATEAMSSGSATRGATPSDVKLEEQSSVVRCSFSVVQVGLFPTSMGIIFANTTASNVLVKYLNGTVLINLPHLDQCLNQSSIVRHTSENEHDMEDPMAGAHKVEPIRPQRLRYARCIRESLQG
jgi:hypothetical protein